MHNIMGQPEKMGWFLVLRQKLDKLIFFPLPNINPDIISVLSVLVALLVFLVPGQLVWILVIISVSLILDWVDGVIAKRYQRATSHGYYVDAICDRLVEAIIGIMFFYPWFYFFLLNSFFMFYSWHSKLHFIAPLRLIFIGALILRIFGINWGWF